MYCLLHFSGPTHRIRPRTVLAWNLFHLISLSRKVLACRNVLQEGRDPDDGPGEKREGTPGDLREDSALLQKFGGQRLYAAGADPRTRPEDIRELSTKEVPSHP